MKNNKKLKIVNSLHKLNKKLHLCADSNIAKSYFILLYLTTASELSSYLLLYNLSIIYVQNKIMLVSKEMNDTQFNAAFDLIFPKKYNELFEIISPKLAAKRRGGSFFNSAKKFGAEAFFLCCIFLSATEFLAEYLAGKPLHISLLSAALPLFFGYISRFWMLRLPA